MMLYVVMMDNFDRISSPQLVSWLDIYRFCDSFKMLMLPACCRSGHIILFSLPCDSAQPQLELGMILTVWRGIKNPRPHSGDVQVASCVAFRAVQLAMENEERMKMLQHECS